MMFRSLAFWRQLLSGSIVLTAAAMLAVGGTPAFRPLLPGLFAGWLVLLVFWHYLFPTPRWFRRTVDLMLANVALFLVLGEVVLQTYTALGGRSLLDANNIDARRL
ncbi:MAG: hypothetical protein AB7K24_06705, partial [Gemmataceae bacterium]